MKLFNFKKKEEVFEDIGIEYDKEELINIPKKRRARALKLLKEYHSGKVLRVIN